MRCILNMHTKHIASEHAHALQTIAKKKVLVGGCFDVLHIGHIKFLNEAKKQGEHLIVLLESDEFIKSVKRRHPVHSLNERVELVGALEAVDSIITLHSVITDEEYARIIEAIQPHVIAVTKGDKHKHKKEEHAKKVAAEVVEVVELVTPFSSSFILSSALRPLKKNE